MQRIVSVWLGTTALLAAGVMAGVPLPLGEGGRDRQERPGEGTRGDANRRESSAKTTQVICEVDGRRDVSQRALTLALSLRERGQETAPAKVAPAKVAASPERGWVEAIHAGKPCDATAEFAGAVRRIDEIRGQVAFDASGRLVEVDLSAGRISANDADVARLAALPNLARLRLSGAEITPVAVDSIVACKNLVELSLANTQIDDVAVGKLASLPGLASLRIQRAAKLTDACVDALARFPSLSALALVEIDLSDAAVTKIAAIGRLKLVDLRACPRITNAGLAHLIGMKNLRTLRLRGYNINDQSLAIVGKLASLTGLTLEDADISDAGMAQLKHLPLEDLGLFRCFSVTDDGLACLKGFTNLRLLTLRDMPLMGTCLAGLRGKKELASLVLSETGVSDESLQNLAGLTSLARLELRQVPLRDAALTTIGTLVNLRHLDLENTRITERAGNDPKQPRGFACLAALSRLEHLNLKLCIELGDSAVPLLGRLKSLRTLNLSQTNVSPEGVARLKEMLPQCRIERL